MAGESKWHGIKCQYSIGQIVYDRFEDYNGYVQIVELRNFPTVQVIDTGGNAWLTQAKYIRPLTKKEIGR